LRCSFFQGFSRLLLKNLNEKYCLMNLFSKDAIWHRGHISFNLRRSVWGWESDTHAHINHNNNNNIRWTGMMFCPHQTSIPNSDVSLFSIFFGKAIYDLGLNLLFLFVSFQILLSKRVRLAYNSLSYSLYPFSLSCNNTDLNSNL